MRILKLLGTAVTALATSTVAAVARASDNVKAAVYAGLGIGLATLNAAPAAAVCALETLEDCTPIEAVFVQLDTASILTQVVTAGVALMGIYIAVRGILFAKKMIGKFF